MVATKTCTSCNEVKSLSEFAVQRKGKRVEFIYFSNCKTCCAEKSKKRRESLPKQVLQERSKLNREKLGKHYFKQFRLMYLFGLSLEEFEEMKINQHNKCYICDKEKKLVVDHDHHTGVVRKLLCSNCNTALGMINEDVSICKRLINYIEEHNDRLP